MGISSASCTVNSILPYSRERKFIGGQPHFMVNAVLVVPDVKNHNISMAYFKQRLGARIKPRPGRKAAGRDAGLKQKMRAERGRSAHSLWDLRKTKVEPFLETPPLRGRCLARHAVRFRSLARKLALTCLRDPGAGQPVQPGMETQTAIRPLLRIAMPPARYPSASQ